MYLRSFVVYHKFFNVLRFESMIYVQLIIYDNVFGSGVCGGMSGCFKN